MRCCSGPWTPSTTPAAASRSSGASAPAVACSSWRNGAPPGPATHQLGVQLGSDRWPFRRFSWTDHSVAPGDVVRYRVVPVHAGAHALREDLAGDWSDERTVGEPADAPFRGDGHLYAALFELGDEELVTALERLGPRAHLVLSNGSIAVRGDGAVAETAAQARPRR